MATQYGRARNSASLIHRTNTCGGDKKSGIPSTITTVSNRNVFTCRSTCYVIPKVCVAKKFLFNYRPNTKYLG